MDTQKRAKLELRITTYRFKSINDMTHCISGTHRNMLLF